MKSLDKLTRTLYSRVQRIVASKLFKKVFYTESPFEAMFYDNPIMSFLVDPETRRVVDANNAVISYLGYDKEKLLSMKVSDFSMTSVDARDTAFRDAHLGAVYFPRQFVLANGSLRDVEIHSGPIIIHGKELFYSTAIDITEKKLHEQQLKLFQQIFTSANDAITVADPNDNLILVNDAFSKMYGYSSKEVIGKPTSILWSNTNHPEELENIINDTKKGEWRGELYNRRKDGTEFPIYLSASPVVDKDNRIVALVGIARDITKERTYLGDIAASERRFREFVDMLPEPVFEIDISGHLNFVNEQGLKIFGYTREDYNRGIAVSDVISPEEHSKAFKRIREALETGEILSDEYTVRLKDGSTFPALIMTSRILQDGKPVGLRGLITDISRQKAVQKELRDELEKNSRVSLQQGYVPICANCKNIREENGKYVKLEAYFMKEGYQFSHGICPDCMPILYPNVSGRINSEDKST